MSSAQKWYAVMDFKLNTGPATAAITNMGTHFRTLKSRPQHRVDMRKRPDAVIDDVVDALHRYIARNGDHPTSMRLHPAAKDRICGTAKNPTLFGVKVTL